MIESSGNRESTSWQFGHFWLIFGKIFGRRADKHACAIDSSNLHNFWGMYGPLKIATRFLLVYIATCIPWTRSRNAHFTYITDPRDHDGEYLLLSFFSFFFSTNDYERLRICSISRADSRESIFRRIKTCYITISTCICVSVVQRRIGVWVARVFMR